MIITPMTMPALNMLNVGSPGTNFCKSGVMNWSAK